MLRIPLDKVHIIIAMARQALGREPPDDETVLVDGGAEEGQPLPSSEEYDETGFDAVFDYVDSLNGDELADLLALVWVGRGDFEPADWGQARTEADHAIGDGDAMAEILQDPTLPDDLEAGLDCLGYAGPDE